MASRRAVLAVFQVVLLVVSVASFGVVAGAAASTETATGGTALAGSGDTDLASSAQTSGTAPINASLDSNTTNTVIVKLTQADVPETASEDEVVDILKNHAEQTQSEAVGVASNNPGLSVQQRLWLTNALVVEVEPGTDLTPLANADGVTEITDNFEVNAPDPPETTAASTTQTANATYGPEQINATQVWDQYNTMGEGATVAVLDTGVDGDHPAIADSLAKFAEFDSAGNIEQTGTENAYDSGGHGTHTSGLVVGDNSSGEYIGSAPGATLYHGLVLDGGSGSFAQIIGGMQWAVENDADVTSMSLGADGYYDEFITPIQFSEAAGTVVVASAGNSGPGTSGSPGNVYESIAVGASDAEGNIAEFSSGEVVNKSDWFDPPSYWPTSYTVPDVVAPGVDVLSATPDDDYARISGTSMSAPLVAGTVALMESASDNNPSVDLLETALTDTAQAPNGSDPTRYGDGIVDALAATDQVVTDTNVSIRPEPGKSPAGYATPGENVTGSVRVSNVDTVNVTLVGNETTAGLQDSGNVSVYVNGDGPHSLNKSVAVNPPASTDDFTFSVAVDEQRATPAFDVTFENSSSGTNESVSFALKVHPDPIVVDKSVNATQLQDNLSFAAPGTTVALEDGTYTLNNSVYVSSGITLTSSSADRGNVTLDTRVNTGVTLGSHATLSDVTVESNYSRATDTGVVVEGHNATITNVDVFRTAHAIDVLGDDATIHQTSLPASSSNTSIIPSGVRVMYADGVTVSDTSIAITHRNARGISAQNAFGTTIVDTSVQVDGPDGVSTAAHAVELVGTSDTEIRDSDLTSEAGAALGALITEDAEVANTPLEGSDVASGATGTITMLGGSYATTSDEAAAILDAAATKQTETIAGESVTSYSVQALELDEFRTAAAMANESYADEIAAQFPNADLDAIEEMNATERVEYANETLGNLSREEIETIVNATKEVGTSSHTDAELEVVDSPIRGGYAPVLAGDAQLKLTNASVTNSSYSKWGIYAVSSSVWAEDSTIDPTTGDVAYETGVYSINGDVFLENTTTMATYGVENLLSYTATLDAEFEGQVGVTGLGSTYAAQTTFNTTDVGIADAYAGSYASDFNSRTGILGESVFAMYSDFEDTSYSIDAFDDYDSEATMNWFGSDRGPTTSFEATGGAPIDDDVRYDPFLTKPPSELDLAGSEFGSQQGGTQAFATDVVMEPGQAYSFSVPGPTEGNLSQMFNGFTGSIHGFNASTQSWVHISTGNDEQLSALDALLVVPDTPARAVVEFEESSDPTKVPSTKDLHEGWNFVGAPQYGDADDAFAASSADPARLVNTYNGPYSQLQYEYGGWSVYTFDSDEYPPDVSAFEGYFVYAEENGSLAANVPSGVTIEEFLDSINAYGGEEQVPT